MRAQTRRVEIQTLEILVKDLQIWYNLLMVRSWWQPTLKCRRRAGWSERSSSSFLDIICVSIRLNCWVEPMMVLPRKRREEWSCWSHNANGININISNCNEIFNSTSKSRWSSSTNRECWLKSGNWRRVNPLTARLVTLLTLSTAMLNWLVTRGCREKESYRRRSRGQMAKKRRMTRAMTSLENWLRDLRRRLPKMTSIHWCSKVVVSLTISQ